MFIGYGNDDVFYGSGLVIHLWACSNEIIWGQGEALLVLMKSWRAGDTAEYSGIKARYTISKKEN